MHVITWSKILDMVPLRRCVDNFISLNKEVKKRRPGPASKKATQQLCNFSVSQLDYLNATVGECKLGEDGNESKTEEDNEQPKQHTKTHGEVNLQSRNMMTML